MGESATGGDAKDIAGDDGGDFMTMVMMMDAMIDVAQVAGRTAWQLKSRASTMILVPGGVVGVVFVTYPECDD